MADIFKASETPTSTKPPLPAKEYEQILRQGVTNNPFAAFIVKPHHMHFETQDKGEQVLLMLRKAFITNIGWLLTTLILCFVPLIVLTLIDFSAVAGNYMFVGTLFWYLFVFGYAFGAFLVWYFNVYIITDERVIDYDFYSLLYKRVSAAKIQDIQDVTYEMSGIESSILNYGNVFIQTAGERIEIEFVSIPNPQVVVRLLNELILEEEQEALDGRTR